VPISTNERTIFICCDNNQMVWVEDGCNQGCVSGGACHVIKDGKWRVCPVMIGS
jgi:hypothetical protein